MDKSYKRQSGIYFSIDTFFIAANFEIIMYLAFIVINIKRIWLGITLLLIAINVKLESNEFFIDHITYK